MSRVDLVKVLIKMFFSEWPFNLLFISTIGLMLLTCNGIIGALAIAMVMLVSFVHGVYVTSEMIDKAMSKEDTK